MKADEDCPILETIGMRPSVEVRELALSLVSKSGKRSGSTVLERFQANSPWRPDDLSREADFVSGGDEQPA